MPDSHTVVFAAARGDADINAMGQRLLGRPYLHDPGSWVRIVDTSLASPFDTADVTTAPSVHDTRYAVATRSIVVLAILSQT
jgi:hypothetical protein